MNSTSAVATSTSRAAGSSSRARRHSRNRITASEPVKISSCPQRTPPSPTESVMSTNARLPPRIHQLGRVFSSPCTASAAAISAGLRPRRRSRAAARILSAPCSTTPATDSTGMTSEIQYTRA